MPTYRLEEFAEGGLINDRSGKATKRMRQERRGKRISVPDERPRGNPALKKFRK